MRVSPHTGSELRPSGHIGDERIPYPGNGYGAEVYADAPIPTLSIPKRTEGEQRHHNTENLTLGTEQVSTSRVRSYTRYLSNTMIRCQE